LFCFGDPYSSVYLKCSIVFPSLSCHYDRIFQKLNTYYLHRWEIERESLIISPTVPTAAALLPATSANATHMPSFSSIPCLLDLWARGVRWTRGCFCLSTLIVFVFYMLICVDSTYVFQVICSLIFNPRSILDLFLGSIYFRNWFEYVEDEMVQVDCLWNLFGVWRFVSGIVKLI
jgi:hypothetical protein